ncbi:hypothetical protein SAMN05216371_0133 [Streptomyces sp. TLI_053]|uniref:terpene synthase family protein n=1 Tax=Streptomyces sp. TLI_053 TaxID=1855352 RepID=UPI00087B919D|nr:terpene synthase family protein [Streptomyces sp. TLI_053]SDS54522.1 hypothetical protein SAMN05216371_0133 [Streptomyces sp. TLI_053]
MVEFHVPARYCPLHPSRPHPAQEHLESRALDWLAAQGLFTAPEIRRKAEATKSHILVGQVTPDAPTDLVQPGVDWAYLMFLFDDLRTDLGPTATSTGKLMNWLHDWTELLARPDHLPHGASADPLMNAFAALSRRVRDCTLPQLWRRWVEVHRDFSWGALWESARRTTGAPTSFDDFLAVRARLAGSALPLISAEIACGLSVPEPERHHPLVRAAVEAAWTLIGLDDDIYSLPKETLQAVESGREPSAEPSAVPLLQREHHCDTATAVALLTGYRDRIMHLLLRLRHRADQAGLARDTLAYLDLALLEVRVDAIDWPPLVPRYTDPVGTPPQPIRLVWGELTNRPPKTDTPLAYPSVSWWWDHL